MFLKLLTFLALILCLSGCVQQQYLKKSSNGKAYVELTTILIEDRVARQHRIILPNPVGMTSLALIGIPLAPLVMYDYYKSYSEFNFLLDDKFKQKVFESLESRMREVKHVEIKGIENIDKKENINSRKYYQRKDKLQRVIINLDYMFSNDLDVINVVAAVNVIPKESVRRGQGERRASRVEMFHIQYQSPRSLLDRVQRTKKYTERDFARIEERFKHSMRDASFSEKAELRREHRQKKQWVNSSAYAYLDEPVYRGEWTQDIVEEYIMEGFDLVTYVVADVFGEDTIRKQAKCGKSYALEKAFSDEVSNMNLCYFELNQKYSVLWSGDDFFIYPGNEVVKRSPLHLEGVDRLSTGRYVFEYQK